MLERLPGVSKTMWEFILVKQYITKHTGLSPDQSYTPRYDKIVAINTEYKYIMITYTIYT